MSNYSNYIKALKSSDVSYINLIELIDENEVIAKSIKGDIFETSGAISISFQNGMRRTANVVIDNSTNKYDIDVNKLWIYQKIKIYKGIEYKNEQGEIESFLIPQGVFYINNPQDAYEPSTKTISFECLDKWSRLNGELGGTLEATYTFPKSYFDLNGVKQFYEHNMFNMIRTLLKTPLKSEYKTIAILPTLSMDIDSTTPGGQGIFTNIPFTLTDGASPWNETFSEIQYKIYSYDTQTRTITFEYIQVLMYVPFTTFLPEPPPQSGIPPIQGGVIPLGIKSGIGSIGQVLYPATNYAGGSPEAWSVWGTFTNVTATYDATQWASMTDATYTPPTTNEVINFFLTDNGMNLSKIGLATNFKESVSISDEDRHFYCSAPGENPVWTEYFVNNVRVIDNVEPMLNNWFYYNLDAAGNKRVMLPYSITKPAGGKISDIIGEISDILGAVYYYNREGRFVLEPTQDDSNFFKDSEKEVVWKFDETNIDNISESHEWGQIYNQVVAKGTIPGVGSYVVTVQNVDPESPVSVDRIGAKTIVYDDLGVYDYKHLIDATLGITEEKALQMVKQMLTERATYFLKMHTAPHSRIVIKCKPIPHLDVNQIILVNKKAKDKKYLIKSITMPLNATESMTIEASTVFDLTKIRVV